VKSVTFVLGSNVTPPNVQSWTVDEDCQLVSAIFAASAVLSDDPELLETDLLNSADPQVKTSWFLQTAPLGLIKIPLLKGSTVFCGYSSSSTGYVQMFLDTSAE
jgi:hypothetical protein